MKKLDNLVLEFPDDFSMFTSLDTSIKKNIGEQSGCSPIEISTEFSKLDTQKLTHGEINRLHSAGEISSRDAADLIMKKKKVRWWSSPVISFSIYLTYWLMMGFFLCDLIRFFYSFFIEDALRFLISISSW